LISSRQGHLTLCEWLKIGLGGIQVKIHAITIAALAIVTGSDVAASELSVRVCRERMNNLPAWQKGHYAFAINAEKDHCGWKWNADSPNHASATALRGCNSKSRSQCVLVYVREAQRR
jgi:hypothetical protein